MKTRALYFTGPKRIEIRETPRRAPAADEVLVETICSSISAGTEMLIYRGQFPNLGDVHDHLSDHLKFPLAYGYACVGRIVEAGRDVNKDLLNKIVFAFHPHASTFYVHPSSLLFVPENLSPEAASFLPNMETAVNLVQDGAPVLGENVLVLGQGVVGLLTTALLKEFPLASLWTSDSFALRRSASLSLGVTSSIDPYDAHSLESLPQDFDLTYELSGSPTVLNNAIAHTRFSGRVVVGSWYGEKRAPIDLGGAFHRSRIKLISSQVSTIASELSARWDKARRFGVVWDALNRIQPQRWITHRFPIQEAEKAYRLLDENPHDAIQIIFEYGP
jgi:2-desacetyl-2-hydroxyethyl bacteriochlorophyllide A dehydrogenase